ncbi:hypothetical protein [Haloarcula amylolytica]|nr:hypothetical protein [Haloarcula amylolytica]
MPSVPCVLFTDDFAVVDAGIALRLRSGYPLKIGGRSRLFWLSARFW